MGRNLRCALISGNDIINLDSLASSKLPSKGLDFRVERRFDALSTRIIQHPVLRVDSDATGGEDLGLVERQFPAYHSCSICSTHRACSQPSSVQFGKGVAKHGTKAIYRGCIGRGASASIGFCLHAPFLHARMTKETLPTNAAKAILYAQAGICAQAIAPQEMHVARDPCSNLRSGHFVSRDAPSKGSLQLVFWQPTYIV